MNILLSSGGRRVALLRQFRRALKQLDLGGKVVTCDMSPTSSAYHEADAAELVPRVTAPGYVDRILEICRAHDIQMVIPLIDPELPVLASARSRFEAEGILAVISGPGTTAISNDKRATERFFQSCGVATPKVHDAQRALAGEFDFPLFIKPLNCEVFERLRDAIMVPFDKTMDPRTILDTSDDED